MKALVVDDSHAMRLILGRTLEPLGFSVSEAADGAEALRLVRAGLVPDLVLVDWNMPEVSGLDVLMKPFTREAVADKLGLLGLVP